MITGLVYCAEHYGLCVLGLLHPGEREAKVDVWNMSDEKLVIPVGFSFAECMPVLGFPQKNGEHGV